MVRGKVQSGGVHVDLMYIRLLNSLRLEHSSPKYFFSLKSRSSLSRDFCKVFHEGEWLGRGMNFCPSPRSARRLSGGLMVVVRSWYAILFGFVK